MTGWLVVVAVVGNACAAENGATKVRGAAVVATKVEEERGVAFSEGRQLQDAEPPAPTGPSLRPMGTTAAPIGCYENFAWADTTDPEQVVPPANAFLFGSTDGCVCLLASSP